MSTRSLSKDAELAARLRISIARLHRRLVAEGHAGNPLPIGAMGVLGILSRDGPMTVGELAARERVRRPSMTRIVNFLEQAGYVLRTPHGTDARIVQVTITEAGETRVRLDRRQRDTWLAQRLRDLTDDERDVLRLSVPIIEALSRS